MFAIIVSCTYSCGKTQVTPSRHRQVVEYRSAKQECYREALPNTETISLPDVHTKCCSTVEHGLHLLIQYGYDVTCDQVQIFCDASAQQTKETCKDTNKDFASHFNKVKNVEE